MNDIRLVVAAVHRVTSRPWAFVTGRLQGSGLRIGDEMTTKSGDIVVVRYVEFHGTPGMTTIAVDADRAGVIRDGIVLIRR